MQPQVLIEEELTTDVERGAGTVVELGEGVDDPARAGLTADLSFDSSVYVRRALGLDTTALLTADEFGMDA